MIDRPQIESLLRANGLSVSATDDEVRSLLIDAKWLASDVEIALTILRGQSDGTTEVSAIHQVFRSDQKLNPAEIKQLLGVTVTLSSDNQVPVPSKPVSRNRAAVAYVVLIFALLISIVVIVLYRDTDSILYDLNEKITI